MNRIPCIRCSPAQPCESCPKYVDYMVVELFVSVPEQDILDCSWSWPNAHTRMTQKVYPFQIDSIGIQVDIEQKYELVNVYPGGDGVWIPYDAEQSNKRKKIQADMSALASAFECEKCGPTYCDKCPNKE